MHHNSGLWAANFTTSVHETFHQLFKADVDWLTEKINDQDID